MKLSWLVLVAATVAVLGVPLANAQDSSEADSTGLPGDNFSLQGALDLFKQASSPEEFEKLLNTQDNHVNNLDLNGDGEIDYVRVIDKGDRDAHAFVLQVPVSEKEYQDIAVIELEKTGDASADVQIVGDEDIYGEQTIVEPSEGGNQNDEGDDHTRGGRPHFAGYYVPPIVVNVWAWPCVRFVYAPRYTVWVSPWRWRVYPAWWRPWHPLAWHMFHPFRARYRAGFAVVHTNRVMRAHRMYVRGRTTSVSVRTRNHASIQHYRVTRTTTIKGKDGRTKVRTTRTKVGKRRR